MNPLAHIISPDPVRGHQPKRGKKEDKVAKAIKLLEVSGTTGPRFRDAVHENAVCVLVHEKSPSAEDLEAVVVVVHQRRETGARTYPPCTTPPPPPGDPDSFRGSSPGGAANAQHDTDKRLDKISEVPHVFGLRVREAANKHVKALTERSTSEDVEASTSWVRRDTGGCGTWLV